MLPSVSIFGSNAETTHPKPATAAPPFPTFLLPSLPLPFRRRRRHHNTLPSNSRSNHEDDEEEYDDDDDVSEPPSLSSSVDSAATSATAISATTSSSHPQASARVGGGSNSNSSRNPGRRTTGAAAAAAAARPTPATLRCGICATDFAFAAQIVSKGFTGRHGRAFLVSAPAPTTTPSSSPSATAATTTTPPPGELVNIKVGRPENRQLVTGAHVVADISCRVCGTKVGWKYVDAREFAQRYKVGKFILETARVVAWRGWDEEHQQQQHRSDDGDDDFDTGFEGEGAAWSDDDYDAPLGSRQSSRKKQGSGGEGPEAGGSDATKDDEEDDPVMFDSEDEDECEDIFAGTWNAETVAKRRKARRAAAAKRV